MAIRPTQGAVRSGASSAPPKNRAPLAPQPYRLLPTGAIKPVGWLRRQLQIQADGMGGHLDETWPDVGPNSGWLGGTGESWERGPYFLDGLLPLAWQLDSAPLKAKAQRFLDWTLDHPWPNGMIGPRSNDDWWPRMVMLKVLTQYHELTGDARVIPVMTRYFHHQLEALPGRPLRDWGKFRWQDEVASIVWLYNRTGDAKLLELARLLQRQGYDWQGLFADYPYRTKTTLAAIGMDRPDVPGEPPQGLRDPALSVHGVNNAQALKVSPIWSLISGSAKDRAAFHRQIDALDRYHGLPIGLYSADEHLAGRSPSQGLELCAIVEALYSLEHALAITGDPAIGDRIERIAYNALPATFTDDMWAHQYDQQPNQIRCSRAKGPWTTNGREANLFGLEPHFGCCTANFHQGWPRLTASLWMASEDGGLVAAIHAPCEVTTTVADVPVRIREETDYPFRETIAIHVDPARPARFPIHLRIPVWAQTVAVRVNGAAAPEAKPGSFARIERDWKAGDRIDIALTSSVRTVAGFHGARTVEQGPLVFALPVAERWEKWRPRGLTADWEVHPAGSWAYGLAPDARFHRIERSVGPVPFSRRDPPVALVTEGRSVSNWPEVDGSAAPPPEVAIAKGTAERLVLIPYGAPKLRVAAFPGVGES
ncbi:glycoside hydrolase family 127 protein [Sphingomonas sp. PL-96]|uniref:beta-L-arabinofuranosidase domain-containing protein n=1 Tax=Sphingomonas sp. PL-96 TaxID=2887201 RepID=UPI001E2E6CEE|nr:beta-L-arabinofuranosidase domain-containing protein [Sphingomonas sp. PL-96]MCC2976791.1 glycoside hydrolase family 127 protein [Sphingomonas sp. PL-96]